MANIDTKCNLHNGHVSFRVGVAVKAKSKKHPAKYTFNVISFWGALGVCYYARRPLDAAMIV